MENNSDMEEMLPSFRKLALEDGQVRTESKCPLVHGDFLPIPSLRSLAFQSLVLNCWPVEEFLPGEGYQDHYNNLRLLTRDCEGEYIMTRFDESFVYEDGSEGTEVDKKKVRDNTKVGDIVRVVKNSHKKWEIGEIIDFSPAGCLRHVFDLEDDEAGVSEITEQEWIEGSSLVFHRFMKWDYSRDDTASDEDVGKREENFGVASRIVVTFYQDKFIYKERVANTRKCSKCGGCSYVYSVDAWFSKISSC